MARSINENINRIKEQWENFIKINSVDNKIVREGIIQSWKRCKELKVDPYGGEGRDKLEESALEQLIQKNLKMVEIAQPFMDTIYHSVKGSDFMVVLSDKEGWILHVCGDPGILIEAAGEIKFLIGVNWSEQAVGTNAIGTALVSNTAIQVTGAEHYCQYHHRWTCSASPIHNHFGETIGCLDISGPAHLVNSHTLGMIVAAVEAIENQLLKEELQEEKNKAYELLSAVTRSVTEGLLALDNHGRITHINPSAYTILGIVEKYVEGKRLNSVIGPSNKLNEFARWYSQKTDVELVIDQGKERIHCTVSSFPIKREDGTIDGIVFSLREIKKVHRLVNKMVGATARFTCQDIIGESDCMKKALKMINVAARSPSNVLLTGESGTGKELFAQAIHNHSSRRQGPFVAVNCGALPRELIQSELFGYSEGAFTGAKRGGNPGKFELANEGTLFLDEIGDMPLELQINLLRVLQERKVIRVGGDKETAINVRIIAATNKDLIKDVEEGRFRQDLFFRLNVFSIHIPPLRERGQDIELMTKHLIEVFSESLGKNITGVEPGFYQSIKNYAWPGNVRELQNAVEFAINMAEENILSNNDLPKNVISYPRMVKIETDVIPLMEMERMTVESTLNRFNGNITKTARALGIGRNTLYDKIKRLGVRG